MRSSCDGQVSVQTQVGMPCHGLKVNMRDPIRIRSGSAGKHWPEADWMILAHRLASGPDPFVQNLT